MIEHGKKYKNAQEKLKSTVNVAVVPSREALQKVKELAFAKFDETVDVAVNLGIDASKGEQVVRGSVILPHGSGKKTRVLVFAEGAKVDEAKAAGADYVGFDELVDKILGGWTDFDVAVATPDMMGTVGRLGKILGPKGLMPNPKVGTVTMDVTRALNEIKAGKIEYRTDKAGNIHAPLGRMSFEAEKLLQNYFTLIETLIKAKPSAAKGTYVRNITLSSTMSPGVPVNTLKLAARKDA